MLGTVGGAITGDVVLAGAGSVVSAVAIVITVVGLGASVVGSGVDADVLASKDDAVDVPSETAGSTVDAAEGSAEAWSGPADCPCPACLAITRPTTPPIVSIKTAAAARARCQRIGDASVTTWTRSTAGGDGPVVVAAD